MLDTMPTSISTATRPRHNQDLTRNNEARIQVVQKAQAANRNSVTLRNAAEGVARLDNDAARSPASLGDAQGKTGPSVFSKIAQNPLGDPAGDAVPEPRFGEFACLDRVGDEGGFDEDRRDIRCPENRKIRLLNRLVVKRHKSSERVNDRASQPETFVNRGRLGQVEQNAAKPRASVPEIHRIDLLVCPCGLIVLATRFPARQRARRSVT